MSDNGQQWEYTEHVKGSQRYIKTHGMRISRARLLKSLTPALIDCQREIAIAYDLVEKGWGYALLGIKTTNMGRVGGRGEPSQEMIDTIRKKIGKLHSWQFQTKKQWVDAVSAIEEHGMTASEYATRFGAHHSTIVSWYKRGLNEYAILNGMGNQL